MNSVKQEKIVRKYREQGVSIRNISEKLGISKYQVEKLVYKIGEPLIEVKRISELLDPHRSQIIDWLENGKLTGKLIHKRLLGKKIDVSESSVCRYIRSLKKPEVYVPVFTPAGEEAQIDFGYLGLFEKNGKPSKIWVFNMVLSFSRYAYYKIVTDQTTFTFLQCHQEGFEFFGGVPKSVKIDNLSAGVMEADFYQPLIQQQYADFLEHYGTTVLTARICRGQDKGKVEAGVKYVKNSFLKNLQHRNYDQLVEEIAIWNRNTCNLRLHGATRKIPHEEFIKKEKAKLKPLPPQRYEIYTYEERKVNQFGHIYYQYNQYSVPHHYAGELVRIASNRKVLKIYKERQQIALHTILQKTGEFVTEDHHKPYHKRVKSSAYYYEIMEKIGPDAVKFLDLLVNEKPFEWKKICNGIRFLSEKYRAWNVNTACARALAAGFLNYRKVKEICETEILQDVDEKKISGYAHDLRVYDQFVTNYSPIILKEI